MEGNDQPFAVRGYDNASTRLITTANIKNNSRKPPAKAPHKNYYGGLLVIVC